MLVIFGPLMEEKTSLMWAYNRQWEPLDMLEILLKLDKLTIGLKEKLLNVYTYKQVAKFVHNIS